MKTILHKANTRWHMNYGWLDTYHTFSFWNYFDPERIEFWALRVINEDRVIWWEGFWTHPHRNMEIITIPLAGALQHWDSMWNSWIIQKWEIQVMSAWTWITHSEMNANEGEAVHFLQIWIQSKKVWVEPRYGQITIKENHKKNDFQTIVTPEEKQEEHSAWIHQDAWFSLANFEKDFSKKYEIKKSWNWAYIFVIKWKAKIWDQILEEKDGLAIYDTENFDLEALEESEILIMDVPVI